MVLKTDDIDHLCNRRIRSVGEILERQLNPGIRRLEKYQRQDESLRSVKEGNSSACSTKPISASYNLSLVLTHFLSWIRHILSELENRKVTAGGQEE